MEMSMMLPCKASPLLLFIWINFAEKKNKKKYK